MCLNKKRQYKYQYTPQCTNEFLRRQTIQAYQLVELNERERTDDKENGKVSPFAHAYCCNNTGGAEQTGNDTKG
jgi:hypothetical protein